MQLSDLFFLLAVVSSTCAEPVVTPKHQCMPQNGPAVVRCEFSRPLLDCRIRVSKNNHRTHDELLDFGNGSLSASAELRHSNGRFLATASYEGDGLAAGHCGVSLEAEKRWLVLLVECLGRTEDQGWSRGFGLVVANDDPVLAESTSSTPSLVVVAAGSDVSVLLKAQAFDGCVIQAPAGFVSVSPGDPIPRSRRYRHHGAGMGRGECGFRLPNVTQQDAGVWSWMGWHGARGSLDRSIAWQATLVVVLATPEAGPVLTVQDPAGLRVDSQLTATCRAPPGAPPAKLTWLLDGQVVRQDDGNDVMPALHVWQPMEAVQTFKRRLSEDDVGKRLECRAEQPTNSWSASDTWTIATTAEPNAPTQSVRQRTGA